MESDCIRIVGRIWTWIMVETDDMLYSGIVLRKNHSIRILKDAATRRLDK